MNTRKLISQRNMYVVKSNDLIRARYSLTVQQQKILLYILSLIKPDDTYDTEYQVSVRDICQVCNINAQSGRNFQTIKEDLRKLTERQWGVFPNGETKTISWIGDITFKEGAESGQVLITLNKNLAPYLFELRGNYTQYKLVQALVLKHAASIRLLEILYSYIRQKKLNNYIEQEISFSLEKLRELLAPDGAYPLWGDFHRYVLKPAVTEINEYNDEINVSYDVYKTGRNVSAINFIINPAKPIQSIQAHERGRKRL